MLIDLIFSQINKQTIDRLQSSNSMQNDQEKKQIDQIKEAEGDNTQKLSKGQKKKLKEKQKKEQEMFEAKNGKKLQVKEEKTQAQNAQKEDKPTEEPKKQPKKDKNKKAPKINAAALLAKKKLEEQERLDVENARIRREYEQEEARLKADEEESKRLEEEAKLKKEAEDKQRERHESKIGLKMSKKQKEKIDLMRKQMEDQKNAPVVEERTESKEPHEKTEVELKADKDKVDKLKKKQDSSVLRDDRIYFERKEGDYRSPVCAILGHVDTGKTTLLDKIRKTNVQEGEAGGITQQIGATFFPEQKLKEEVGKCTQFMPVDVNVPGLLIIDTPGHESFSNLRSRGSSLCDIAILVIDLMHGLENQTIESLELLKKRKTPFVVALNKIDRCYAWESMNDIPSYLALKRQKPETINDYETKLNKVIAQLNEIGYNADMYWKVEDPEDYIPLVPTSGITGQGLPDILGLLVKYSLSLKKILKKIKVKKDVFNCTVMEVKMIEGYGTTIDCILVDGKIRKEDQIVLLGFKGPIVTKVKAVLTPHPMKQMRVKDQYLHHTEIYAANGVKVAATGLDEAVAGTPLFVCHTQEEIEEAKIICADEFDNIKKKIKLEKLGVGVAASTLGSLEALLEYLGSRNVPVSYITVGPVSKDDVMKAMKSVLSEVPQKRKQQYCCMLVFDVKVLHDASKFAEENGVKVFTANIIYHLMDHFTLFVEEVRRIRREKEGKDAIFPCALKQVATFRKNDPVVLGVDVQFGVLKIGTPITIYRKKYKGEKFRIGYVESIEHNHKKLKEARKATGSVAVCLSGQPKIQAGKDFEEKDKLVSIISRKSIDCLKEHYRSEVTKEEWELVIELKKYFEV